MKQLLMILTLLMALGAHAEQQNGQSVDLIFRRYGHEKGCKMVEMHDTKVRGYAVKTYKSLTYKSTAYKRFGRDMDALLKNDRRTARKIREVVDDGRVVSGYYMLPSTAGSPQRYVLFGTREGGNGAIIYIEGHLQPNDIVKLCYGQ